MFSRLIFDTPENRYEGVLHLNGVGAVSSRFTELVGANTGIDVRAASMARFGTVVPSPYLVRQDHSVYCPKCVLSNSPLERAHSRLVWELEFVTACPRHGLKLQVRKCGALPCDRLPPAERPRLPDVCRDCGSIGLRCQEILEPASVSEQWVANQAAELVSLSDNEVRTLSLDRLRAGIASAVGHRFDGQPVKAARMAGLARATVLTWLQGNSRPALGALFRFAIHAEANVVGLFRGEFIEAICSERSAPKKKSSKRRNWDAISQALKEEIISDAPASLDSFAARLEVDRSQLRRTLPTESSLLIEKAAAFKHRGAQLLHEQWVSEFTKVALDLRREGITVCRKNVETRSGIFCFKRDRARHRALMLALKQFQV
jgi:TniQ protein